MRAVGETKKEFLKIFNEMCYSRSAWQVWADLMSVIACSLANAVDKREEMWAAREKEYEECIKRLGGVENPAKCFAAITMALEENPDQDFLGELYMTLNLGNHWKGQFFTPYHICEFMSKITIGEETSEQIEKQGFIAVNDCACGAGATLIAAANTFKERGINYQRDVLFVAQDIDRVVGMMCYIQLSLLGCAGYVCIANTITNPICGDVLFPLEKEGQEFWYTPMFASEVWHYRCIAHKMDILIRGFGKNVQKDDSKTGFMIFYSFLEEDFIMTKTENADKRTFASGAEKLKYEQEQCLANVNDKYKAMAKQQYDMVFSVLIKKCEDEPEFDVFVKQEHKSWGRCMAFCGKKAMEICNPTDKQKELARKGEQPIAAPATSAALFQWIDEYYKMDDKAEIEKQEKAEAKKATADKKRAEDEKKVQQKKEAAKKENAQKKAEYKPKNVEKKVKKNEQEGQMSLFDFFG